MHTRVTEVAPGIHQLTTYVEEADFSFNQYLIADDEPLLFHTGGRQLFPLVRDAITSVLPVEQLRWISFGHVESDESGAMNDFLALAPQATVAQSVIGCMVQLNDIADRPPRPLVDGEVLHLGHHSVRWIDTPHVPHGWESGVLYDETTRTLLCGDLFTRAGAYPATSVDDIVEPARAGEDLFHATALSPATGATIRRLAELDIATLALMHGPAFSGDCRAALLALADEYDRRLAEVQAAAA